MGVISLRLKDKEFKRLEELSKIGRKDKSTVARELLEYGWDFLMVKLYKEGKLSLGSLSSKLELSISETIDLLSELGVNAPIDYDDYLSGFDVFKNREASTIKKRLEKKGISFTDSVKLLRGDRVAH